MTPENKRFVFSSFTSSYVPLCMLLKRSCSPVCLNEELDAVTIVALWCKKGKTCSSLSRIRTVTVTWQNRLGSARREWFGSGEAKNLLGVGPLKAWFYSNTGKWLRSKLSLRKINGRINLIGFVTDTLPHPGFLCFAVLQGNISTRLLDLDTGTVLPG